jgi:hypothetical protein
MNKKANAQKNTLLKNAQANAESTFFKRVFFLPTKNPPFLFLQIYFSHRTGFVRNRTDIASNVNRFGQSGCKLDTTHLRTDRRVSGNKGFKKLAVQWLNQVQFSNQTFVLVDSFVLRNRQLLKPPKRYQIHLNSFVAYRPCGL